jgi:hypothetical protein
MEDQLVSFIRSRKRESSADIDWQAKKDSWIKSVEELYRQVRELLGDLIDSKDVSTRTFPIPITENRIGSYSIPALELTIGSESVEFRPKGITVIGAAGRVDIRGERDSVTLLKDEASVASSWSVLIQRVPRVETVPLDRDSLKFALERVMLP